MNLTNTNESMILDYFNENELQIKDLGKLIKYLKDNGYIKTKEDILFENIEALEIKVPSWHYLNEDYIVDNDNDYINIGGNKYLNAYRINEEGYDLFANELITFKSEEK